MSRFTFNKSERIKSKKLISELFESGHRMHHGPILLIWKHLPSDLATAQLMFGMSIPRRTFKKAIIRNRIKRHWREIIRHEKLRLQESTTPNNSAFALFLVYTGKSIPTLEELTETTKNVFNKWLERSE